MRILFPHALPAPGPDQRFNWIADGVTDMEIKHGGDLFATARDCDWNRRDGTGR